jgi:glycerophosphoryl diester phosphodiesterase
LLVHLLANGISLLVLTPLYTMLLGWLVLASGDVALTDEDILQFILSPAGLLIFLFAAAMFVAFLILEQAAFFLVNVQAFNGRRVGMARLGRVLLERFRDLFLLAAIMVVRACVVAIPFLAAIAAVAHSLLAEFDINYYLAERPPEAWWAAVLSTVCLLAMAWLLFRVLAGWVMALPLLLLERRRPREVLRQSREQAAGLRKPIALSLLVWIALNAALLSLIGWLLDWGTAGAIGLAGSSLRLLVWLMGALLITWFLANLLVTFPVVAVSLKNGALAPARPARAWKLSGLSLAAIFIAVSLPAGWLARVAVERQSSSSDTEIVAHRGASAEAPENTLAAMELAIEQGADWLEIDVQQTADGDIAVIHDSDLMKVARTPLRVREATLSELQGVDIGSWFGPEFSGERVPGLHQLLEQVRGRARVIIELKYYGGEQGFEEAVAARVEEAGMQAEVMVMSLSLPGARRMKALRPEWTVGLLSSIVVGNVTALDVDFLAVNARLAKRSLIERARSRGKGVLAWTVNDPALMSAMMSRNVAGIITDRPGLARKVKSDRAGLDLDELLILHVAALIGSEMDSPQ